MVGCSSALSHRPDGEHGSLRLAEACVPGTMVAGAPVGGAASGDGNDGCVSPQESVSPVFSVRSSGGPSLVGGSAAG